MPGTREGGIKAAIKVKSWDPDFYRKIGALGGQASRGGGFAVNRELAVEAGKKGGRNSHRGPSRKVVA